MLRRWPVWIALGVMLAALVRTCWLCDDAYITVRVVDNLLHGHGLRWNVDERVQAYTHPLWLLAMLLARLCTGEFFYSLSLLSIVVSTERRRCWRSPAPSARRGRSRSWSCRRRISASPPRASRGRSRISC